jgi:two-component system sensor histidine kinase/response regulator
MNATRETANSQQMSEQLAAQSPVTTSAPDTASLASEAIANVSHEMRTPLQGTVGLADLLLDSSLQPDQREHVETIRGCALDLLAIVNDILDYAKLGSSTLRLEMLEFDLRQTVEAAVHLLTPQAREKGLELAVLVQQDVPELVAGDPGRLRQILSNLLGNAIKYTDAGEVAVRVRVVEQSPAATVVRFEVSDTGPGITPESQARLFEPFYQVDSSPSRRHGGAGLGLTICRQLVALMGGQMGVESQPGQGSIFWFSVPLVEQVTSSPIKPEQASSLTGLRVLLVADDAAGRSSLLNQLIRWRMRCTGVANEQTALKELRTAIQRQRPFHLALIDMHLPDTDGLDVAAAIKADPSLAQTALILLTVDSYPGHAARARGLGLVGYLTKPVPPSQLYDCIALVHSAASSAPYAPNEMASALITRHSLAEARGRARPRVLVVDNNLINQKAAAGVLNKLGCRVDLAGNGLEALAALTRTRYGLVLMDCHMPEMDGYTAAAEIRRREGRGRRTPIVAMTASTVPGDRELCIRAGMDDYVAKPLRAETARFLLARWLRRSGTATVNAPLDSGSAAALPTTQSAVSALAAASTAGSGPTTLVPIRPHGASQSQASHWPALPREHREATPRPGAAPVWTSDSGQDAAGSALMPHFIRSLPPRLDALRRAAAQADCQVLERTAHSLKGDCSYLGLPRLQALCAGLIALARLGATSEASTYVDVIEQEIGRACRQYEERMADGLREPCKENPS